MEEEDECSRCGGKGTTLYGVWVCLNCEPYEEAERRARAWSDIVDEVTGNLERDWPAIVAKVQAEQRKVN